MNVDQADNPFKSLRKLKQSADTARQAYANEAAIQSYTLALELANAHPGMLDAEAEYDLLAGREACYELLGFYREQQADLDVMKRLAKRMKDVPRQIQVVTSQVTLDNILGNYVEAEQAAKSALKLARMAGDRALEADCLTSLGTTYNSLSNYGQTRACHEAALHIRREIEDIHGEALSLSKMGDCLKDMGQSALAQVYIEKSYSIYRALGDLRGQAGCLNILGIVSRDQAQARSYYEQALGIYQTIGDRTLQANLLNNLGLVYWSLGLYSKARDYLEHAVQTVRELHGRSSLASFFESLGRIYIELENYSEAGQVLEEGLALSREIGERLSETTYLTMLGRVALATGQLEQAKELIWQACVMQRELGTQGYLATSLAWLGATYLALGDREAAYKSTLEAVELLALVGRASDYPTQDVWWLHYQVLKTTRIGRSDKSPKNQNNELDDETRRCLQRTHDAMLAGIVTLSDEGLRRNYLNKVKFNRDILFEWATVLARENAAEKKRKGKPAPAAVQRFTPAPVRIHDRMTRLLDISLQMNATLNPDTLLDFVMDNVIELSGAERGFLALIDESGELDFKVERGINKAEIEHAGLETSPVVLSKVIQTKAPVFIEYQISGAAPTSDEESSLLNLRSAMCVPLLRRLELIGVIYVDNHSISGRFSQADVDLLSLFANQAATAVENARLFRERERRITELSILDEIGRLLSSTLNVEELLETVHRQVSRIFDTTNFFIATYQEGDTEWVGAYRIEGGQHQPAVRRELGLGLTGYILRNHKPILLRSSADNRVFKEVQGISPVGPEAKSWMGVPLTTADKVVGVMAIQSYEDENLYDDHALNLFSTIGAQVAIAIRNTRLYEETNRANKELEAFSYSVSHDLRAPIRAINGFSHILLEDYAEQLDDEGKKHLARVGEASQRMGVLIDDMLRLSRVTRSEMHRTAVDLSQLAQNVIKELRNADPDRQVEVVIAPGLKVNADLNLMRILLENLLGNAWKFTQKHALARIEFGVTEKDKKVTYFVRDDGAGFNMAYVNKLFGAFQRLHDVSEFEGTGIGLATVQRIIHRHGGLVWAEGDIEKGAAFYFTIAGD
jgi:signal transduction histidine kinase/tetratricopeptide (TPR) repeat protein